MIANGKFKDSQDAATRLKKIVIRGNYKCLDHGFSDFVLTKSGEPIFSS